MMLSKCKLKQIVFNATANNLKGRTLCGKRYVIKMCENNQQEKVVLCELRIKELYSLCKKLHARGYIEPAIPWQQI